MLACPLQRKPSGRGQADQGLDAGAQHFLDQLQAAAAGNDGNATGEGDLLANQRADQLVQGVVPADIFAAQQQLALIVHEQRRVDCPAMLSQGLELTDALAQALQPMCRRQWRTGQGGQFRQCLLNGLDAAQAATAGTGQLAALGLEVPEGAAGDLHLGMLGRAVAAELDVIDLVGRGDDAAADTEADDKVFKVRGADQHHGLADTVIGNSQGDLFGQCGAVGAGLVQVAVAVSLAGGGNSARRCGRRADRALGIHGAVPAGYPDLSLGLSQGVV
ncbi:hypothetical protein D9M71_92280 [compost metagenome]